MYVVETDPKVSESVNPQRINSKKRANVNNDESLSNEVQRKIQSIINQSNSMTTIYDNAVKPASHGSVVLPMNDQNRVSTSSEEMGEGDTSDEMIDMANWVNTMDIVTFLDETRSSPRGRRPRDRSNENTVEDVACEKAKETVREAEASKA